MSNALAIAAVTSTLRHVLHEALGGPQPAPVGGADVTTLRPVQLTDVDTAGAAATGINVFLYQVTPNHAWNLTDLPTRRPDGSLARRPLAALDLHYLITCYGNDESLDAQRLLARAVLALAVEPVLTPDIIGAAMEKYGVNETSFLKQADLTGQLDLVKLSPTPLSLEELSKLWGTLGTPYLLSVAYTATVVLLEAAVTPRPSLPVRERSISVSVASRPRIAGVDTQPPHGPIVTGSTVVITGSALLGPVTSVTFGGTPVKPAAASTALRLQVTLPDTVPAGVRPVQVVHETEPGPAGSPPIRVLSISNAVAVMVRPTIEGLTLGTDSLTVALAPPLQAGQRAVLTLSRLGGGDPADPGQLLHIFEPVAAADAPRPNIALDRNALFSGTWLARVEVDGVESLPTMVDGKYGAPAVTVP